MRHLRGENDSRLFAEAADLGERGKLTPRISRNFTLEEIAAAHAEAQRGHTRGKIVVTIA